jgi:flagellar motor switch protein FliN/FliY
MATDQNIVDFFDQWVEEFGRAIEMFTGDKPTISQGAVDKANREALEEKLATSIWWRQKIGGDKSFSVWAGAEEDCCAAFGGTNEAKQTLQEMLGQANQGAAAVLSAGFPSPLRCQDGVEEAPRSLLVLEVFEIKISFRGSDLPPIILAVEAIAGTILAGPVAALAKQPEAKLLPPIEPAANSAMLNRLMDLQLPVSVLLGHSVLPIREILKIVSGSLIELDRQIGDYVEIVIHGTVVARGEIVSVKGNYGVRIKEVISQQDRLALKDAA